MNFDLSYEQRLYRDTVGRFLGSIDIAQRRRDRQAPGGHPADRWQQLSELGLLAVAAPCTLGGLGGEAIDLTLIAEAMGHGLAIDPWLENGVLPIRLAAAAGDVALVEALISEGTRAALAFAEPGHRYDMNPRLRADGGTLAGAKTFVLGGAGAELLLVTAVEDGKFGLYVLPAASEGVNRRTYTLVDGSQASEVRLYGAQGRRLDLDLDVFMKVIGDMRLLAAAEILGLAQRAFDDTLIYVKQREQFGVAIGSFQALQHRLVDCYAELELARSLVLRTALEPSDEVSAAATKAHVAAAAMHVAGEAVQLHGGMGQTDELSIGHALKRIMLLDKLFGDGAAALLDYAKAA